MTKTQRTLICTLLLAGFVLRIHMIGSNSYAGDEARLVMLCSGTDFVWQDVHPPLYRILLAGWIRCCGTQEVSTRMLSAIFGTFSLLLVFLIGKELGGTRVGILVLYLAAISPFLLLFSRVSRSFPCFLFFNLSSVWLFLCAIKNEKKIPLYVIATILNLYAGAFGIFTLLCQWIWLVVNVKKISTRKWVTAHLVILLAGSVWISNLRTIIPSALSSMSRVPATHGIVAKVAYALFCFSVGETIFPWSFKCAVPGLFVFMLGAVRGVRMMIIKKWNRELLFLAVFILVPLVPMCTNLDFPHYYLHVAVMYLILVAIGIARMGKALAVTALVLIAGVSAYGIRNVYTGREYHLQRFTDDWRQVETTVRELSDHETTVIAYHDSFLWYYGSSDIVTLDIREPDRTEKQVAHAKRIIFVYTPLSGSFSSTDEGIYAFRDWLGENFVCTQTIAFCENEDREMKRRLLKRSFPEFRVQVLIYERPLPSDGSTTNEERD